MVHEPPPYLSIVLEQVVEPALPSSPPPQASSLSSPHRPPEGTCTALKPHVASVGRDRSGVNALYTSCCLGAAQSAQNFVNSGRSQKIARFKT